MAILAECPSCRRKQSTKRKKCNCGEDLDQAKRSNRVKYWIHFRFPGGKQRKEYVGYSIEEARDAHGKRRGEKRENRIFDILPESKMTFNELTKWYLNLEKVKSLASYGTIKISMNKFNSVFGNRILNSVKLADLEDYQAKRLQAGLAPATIDHEIGKAKTMIIKAFNNDIVSGRTYKTFMRTKKLLRRGSDARDRILSPDEFDALKKHAKGHTKQIIIMGYYTGMRKGEILNLTWDRVNLQKRVIELEAKDTKDNESRNVPICDELYNMLVSMPGRIQTSNNSKYVFGYYGKPMHDIRAGLKKACEDAGIVYGRFEKDGFIFHDLRHTFNTNMRKAGVQESVIMEITGHSTREMFDRYNTIDDEDVQEAANRMEVFLASVTQNVTQKGDQNEKVG